MSVKLFFGYDEEESAKLNTWYEEQNKKMEGRAVGAIGGVYVHTFCNTTLGQVKRVRNDVTGDEIDLTDYNSW
jgi:drug/metabolite transporter superfamily protein YnfA